MIRRIAVATAAVLCATAMTLAAPPTLIHRIELPQIAELCDVGTFSPIPTGLERVVVGPPAGAEITRARLVITFVTSDACQPDFDAGVIQLVLHAANGVDWIVNGDTDLQWMGQGTFTATIETNDLNGENPSRLWDDSYYATIETHIPGHFHQDVSVVDSYWELEYTDPNVVVGDTNCDGVITFDDLDAFVLGLLDPLGYAEMHPFCTPTVLDINGDGTADGLDIQPFVTILLNAPPVGACCLPGGDCDVMSEADCTALGVDGVYLGDLSSCQGSCPMSLPDIDLVTPQYQIDNCNGTHISFDVFGSGFNSDAVPEFLQNGQDPVVVNIAGVPDHTFLTVPDFETECLASPGLWDLRITNPDGGTATYPDAIDIVPCNQPAPTVESVSFSPPIVRTCPGTTPANPVINLGVTITGTNLPNEFFFQSPNTSTKVVFEDATSGEVWYTTFVTQLTLVSSTEFTFTLPIYQGNVFFPMSNPPPGEYRVVVETCTQRLMTDDTVVIQPADPGMCPP